ncbi:MAG TPA: MoxR family ATPase, partial [Pseudomonadales bacterium]|nr:MoxR family ATPase [Pseudomonadales bacterium]
MATIISSFVGGPARPPPEQIQGEMVPDIDKIAASVESIKNTFEQNRYICSNQIATAVYLAYHLKKPVLIEGPPGVGKTELAKTTATMFGLPLIRLQCYEGLDEAKALYEWKYGKQLLYTQVLKETLDEVLQGAKGFKESVNRLHEFGDIFFSEEFIEPRPLLKALKEEHGCVLLIDEVDKSDHEFESLLLEILSDFQVSIPEIGTVKAKAEPPLVFLTSNNTREISDALKRRCLHLYIDYPTRERELKIVRARLPQVSEKL